MIVGTYLWNLLVLLGSHLPNTLTGGKPNETLSARCGRALLAGKRCVLCAVLCHVLNRFDANHCIDEAAGK